jgi:ribosomal protein S6--L-glutamate ligase
VFVLEVNGVPGWKGLQQATGINVADALVEHLVQKVAANKALRGAELSARGVRDAATLRVGVP